MPRRVQQLSLADLVDRYIPDGQRLLIGGFAFSDPMALAHELIRQQRRELQVMKTSGGMLVDLLLGAGCVASLVFCHVWNSVGPEPAHAFRRTMESGIPREVRIDELSYGAYTMGLAAGAWGLPFLPTTPMALAGHDLNRRLWPEKLGVVASPFEPDRLVTVVKSIVPELGVFHVQRVDEHGNAQMDGPTAETRQAIGACEQVVLIAEELVPTEVIRGRPELTVVPGHQVEAIVVEPFSAHPTDAAGYYRRDLEHHERYGIASRTEEGFEAYVAEWITGPGDHEGYRDQLGTDVVDELRLRDRWWAA